MKNRSITLVVLTVLAIFAGGIEQTQAQNHWTLTGSASPTGGYTIIGNDPGTDLGTLGPMGYSAPVYLSANGGDTITLEPGNTAGATNSTNTIELETPNNSFTNYGTLEVIDYGALYVSGNGNIINNRGTITAGSYYAIWIDSANNNTINNWAMITAPEYAIYLESANNNTINNWGTITVPGDYAIYTDPSSYNTVNNWGTMSSGYATIYLDGSYNTVNNWGAIISTGYYAIEVDPGSNTTINNYSGATLSSTNGTIYLDGSNNTVNNWGSITSTGPYGIESYGDNLAVNNWGAITSLAGDAVYVVDTSHGMLTNWGNISATGGDGVDIYHSSRNTLTNWGYISSSSGDGIYIDQSSRNIINNWGSISGAVNGIEIASASRNILNLDGHSSVNGKITIGNSHNLVNLDFTGVNAAYLKNVLLPSLLAQGVNSGVPIPSGTLKFMLRGVNYVIDAPVVNENITSYQLQGVTPNQAAIGASLDSATVNPAPGSPLFNLFNTIDASGNVPAALEALSPQQYEAFGDLAIANASAWVLEIDERLNNIRGGSESIDTSGIGGDTVAALVTGNSKDEGGKEMKESKAVETTPVPNRWGFFASGNGLFFRGNPHDADLQDAKANTVGTLAGVDAKVGDHAVAGVLFAYENSPVDLGNGGNATIESYAGGLYGGWHDDGFYVNGLAAYTRNNYTSTRSIVFPGFAAASNGSTNGNQATANIDGGYDWNVTDRFAVGPIAGLQYVHLDINGFDEAGAGAAGLTIGDQDMDSLQSRLGLHAEYRLLTTAVSSFAAEAHAAWQHEYLNDSRAITASFEGSGLTPFAVQTASPQRDAAVVGADVNYTVHNRLTLFAGYDLQIWNSSYFEQTVNAGLRITW